MTNKHPLREKVFKDSFWTLIATVLSKFGGLIFTIIIARYLLPEGFGVYSLVMSVTLIFVTLADFGMNQAVIRYVSLYIDKDNGKASAYFRYLLKFKVVVSFGASLALLLLS